ncbi:MAG: T9SS type A sorting domain-containing protein [Nonlabens sp.]
MKTKYIFIAIAGLVTILGMVYFIDFDHKTTESENQLADIQQKRQKHEEFIKNSPFSKTVGLSKKERKALGIPPNSYNERMWELTMNPQLGYPTPFEVESIDITGPVTNSVPGNSLRPWEDRGPDNVGGRTRVVFYDPNDVGADNGDGEDYNRVFAGGVGGGLWVNDNINSNASRWSLVPGVAANLNISSYAIDPNDSQTWYLGTGEQHTSGAAVGNGVYKSTDGGATWTSVNLPVAGGGSINGTNSLFTSGLYYVNDILVWDNNGTSEVYVGIGASIYYSPNFNISNPTNILGLQNAGLYRSVDDGSSWNRVENANLSYTFSGRTFYFIPNDFEIGADNTLYMGSIGSPATGDGGGRIYGSTDGLNWNLERVVGGSDRVEIAASVSDPDLFYVLTEVSGSQANVYKTTDGFATLPQISEPDDADLGIPATDFARNQAFYNLVIEVDPTDDQTVYAGGIDLHKSTDGGATWSQISRWDPNRANMNTLNVSFIHADIHALTFHPMDNSQAVVGSDGGISWGSDLANAANSTSAFENRNNGYNVTQFYYGSIAQTNVPGFIGGAQDNGTQTVIAPIAGENSFNFTSGGDGAHVEIDSEDGYAVLTFQFNNHQYWTYPGYGFRYCINPSGCADNSDGDFINVAELDKNNDFFYSNTRLNGSQNAIDVCELLPNGSNCTLLTNSLINGSRPTTMKASPFSTGPNTTLFIGTETSRLLKVTDANTAAPIWENISGINFLGSVSDVDFGDTQQEIYLTMHNYGVENIWYTQDGGVNWLSKDGNLPDIPVKAILKNPLLPNEVLIGTEMGIYATGNFDHANPSWVPQINGMTNVKVLDLDLRTADNTILATTHGRGMFTGNFDTLGVEDENLEDNIKVYPTQIKDGKIYIAQESMNTNLMARIFDLSGQLILEKDIESRNNVEEIEISNLKSGFYILNLKGAQIDKSVKFTIQ